MRLKKKGIKIEVNLSRCRIVSSKSIEVDKQNLVPSQAEILDSFTPNRIEHLRNNTPVFQIIYQHVDHNGRSIRYVSPVIQIEEVTLQYKIMQHSTTNIYIDPVNTSKYYFDVSFLES